KRGYIAGAYTATFVGLFPARDPQYVILVKINDPPAKGESYFAAKAAAPVAKTVLEAALAARDAALDPGALGSRRGPGADTPRAAPAAAIATTAATVPLPLRGAPAVHAGPPRAVPDVHGLPLRAAVHALHRAGLRVEVTDGSPGTTIPAAGAL